MSPAFRPTPLYGLPALADSLGIADVWYKDESRRFGLGSFKAVGASYAITQVALELLHAPSDNTTTFSAIWAGTKAATLGTHTIACASEGNHGHAVAWSARQFGFQCVVMLPEHVSTARERRIRSLGATVIREPGTYDDVVQRLQQMADDHGWHVISDTAYDGYERVPRDIMRGYLTIFEEAALQGAGPDTLTHVFLQAGVGSLAAAGCAFYELSASSRKPRRIVVEPETADCIHRSAIAGTLTHRDGALDTVMSCLACGVPSTIAWDVLQYAADAYLAVSDDSARDAMQRLANPLRGDAVLVAGATGAAGFAGLLVAARDPSMRATVGLDQHARVLLIGTEGLIE